MSPERNAPAGPISPIAAPAMMFLLGAMAVAATVTMARLSGRPADHFTRDPLSVSDQPPYIGFLSNLGVVAWFMAAAIAWMTALVLRSSAEAGVRSRAMFAAAAFITLLGFDDLFMLHEEALQRYLGISEKVTIGCYGVLALSIAIGFRTTWRDTPRGWLIPAGACFAASLAVDFLSTGFGWRLVIEDSLKFMGIVGVLAWTIATAQCWLMPRESSSAIAA